MGRKRTSMVGVACGWVLAVAAHAAPAPTSPQPVAEGVLWLPGVYAPPRQPDGNSLLLETPGGWLVVDSGRHPEHGRALLAAAGDQPVRAVLNTHWHLDHVGGNPALRRAFPDLRVYASPAIDGALRGFLADYATQLREALSGSPTPAQGADWRAELARIEDGAALRPDRAIAGDTVLVVAGREFRVGFEAAATAGDLWLFDARSGVLAAGDLVTLPAPFFDTACPRRWRDALSRLDAVPFTRLVPGHGEPMDRAGFDRWRGAFESLLACADGAAEADACIEGWVREAGPLLGGEAGIRQARDLLGYYLPAVLWRAGGADACR